LLDEKELVVEGVEDNDQTNWIVKAKLSDGFFLFHQESVTKLLMQ